MLINLLENATKYSAPGSPIDVSAVSRDGEIETEVPDRGPKVSQATGRRTDLNPRRASLSTKSLVMGGFPQPVSQVLPSIRNR